MTARRKRIITTLVMVFVLVHLPYYVTGAQHWPFATFPMFSWKMSSRDAAGNAVFECELAYGVPASQAKPEFRLKPPVTGLNNANNAAFRRMLNFPYRGSAYERLSQGCPSGTTEELRACVSQRMVSEALQTVFHRYQKRRHRMAKLPDLAGVKLYRVRYEFSPSTSEFKEAHRTLLGEWTRPQDESQTPTPGGTPP